MYSWVRLRWRIYVELLSRNVGIATDYGLDGPGSNPGGDEIFHPSRPALRPTQPPVKWVPGLSRGLKCGRGVLLTTHPLLVPRSWKSRAITLPTLWGHTRPVTGSLYLYVSPMYQCTDCDLYLRKLTAMISEVLAVMRVNFSKELGYFDRQG